MKCSRCSVPIEETAAYVITYVSDFGVRTVNCCRQCVRAMIGQPAQNRIDALIARVGWTQLPLPIER